VERRLVLKEEVHIRRIQQTERHQKLVTLRKQEALVSRTPIGQPVVPDDRAQLNSDTNLERNN
jgi:stress response protein YsnF